LISPVEPLSLKESAENPFFFLSSALTPAKVWLPLIGFLKATFDRKLSMFSFFFRFPLLPTLFFCQETSVARLPEMGFLSSPSGARLKVGSSSIGDF